MTFSAFIDKIRERAEVRFACEPGLIYDILDEIETEVTERIEELEAQVPMVVKPKFYVNYDCPDCEYRGTLPEPCLYCPGCGAKLDWSNAFFCRGMDNH